VIAMSLVAIAFEWKSEFEPLIIKPATDHPIEIDNVIITKHANPEPPKPKVEVAVKPKSNQPPVIIENNILPETSTVIDVEPIDIDIPIALLTGEVKSEEPDFHEGPVESIPLFPGGQGAFYKYISENMKYPGQARRMGVEGKVFIQFIVNKDGSITDVEVVKGIGSGCDEMAKLVLENAPKFIPAKQRGQPVRYRQIIPIFFKLN
jgi:protein TonB